MELTHSNGLPKKLIGKGSLLAKHNPGMQSQWQIRSPMVTGT